VVSSPSGAGKTTLSRRLLAEHPELSFSVSYTTRPRRGREQDGVDYHFVSDGEFDRMVEAGEFAEWCLVHSRRYGTSLRTMRAALDSGRQILLDIDYQGAEKLRQQFPAEARLVFILPPSMQVLAERLRSRATDSAAAIEARLRKATEELRHYDLYDYLVLNRDLAEAYAELSAIYLVETAHFVGTEPEASVAALAQQCQRERRAELAEKVLLSATASPVGEAALPSSQTPKANPWP
jgi:guanylate kinase